MSSGKSSSSRVSQGAAAAISSAGAVLAGPVADGSAAPADADRGTRARPSETAGRPSDADDRALARGERLIALLLAE